MKMLEYQKMILEKVSFSKDLFVRELKKSVKWLNKKEIEDLINWVRAKFNAIYRNEIENTVKALPVHSKSDKKGMF